ncbi:MAG: DUF3696 domain-containing protein [Candidatus Poribacteria bacterium]|nr:DUF3696 domain-containing protein [Candidatus Poribacteria bacterium]
MITELRVQNFKSWKDTGKLQIAPLTGFFGANSSGKTTILQTLLMLKQTVERPPDWDGVIDFGDDSSLVNLGSFDDLIHQHNLDLSLDIAVAWKLPERQKLDSIEDDSLSFLMSIANKYGDAELSRFCYTMGRKDFEIKWESSGYKYKSEFYSESAELFRCYGVANPFGPLESFKPLKDTFENLFHRICYLGSLRESPYSRYAWQGNHPKDTGQSGKEMTSAILSKRVKLQGIDKQIIEWLQRLDLIDSYRLNPISGSEKNYEFLVRKYKGGPEVRLTDVGFGVSQVLPVLVLCYYVPEGSILILEQPEAHLHPKVQSELADLLIEVVKNRKLQIILESHSEHLLIRLMRRIAEEQISADDTAFYFCEMNEGVSEIERLNVDDYGNITNWPQNFFGDEMGDLAAKTKAEMKRRKADK